MIVSFFGHSEMSIDQSLKERLTEVIEDCIKKGADTFYCGHYGDFDCACARVVKELKSKYPNITSIFITPYIIEGYKERNEWVMESKLYDGSIYPELESVPLRFAISKRNEWMVEQSDIVIAYVSHGWGGSATALRYAKRKKKTIINLAE